MKVSPWLVLLYVAVLSLILYGFVNLPDRAVNPYVLGSFDEQDMLSLAKSKAIDVVNKQADEGVGFLSVLNIVLIIISSAFSLLSILISKKKLLKIKLSTVFVVVSFLLFSTHVVVDSYTKSIFSERDALRLYIMSANSLSTIEKIIGENRL